MVTEGGAPLHADARIMRDVNRLLADCPHADGQCVVVSCREGVVVLRGAVSSYYHRQLAQAAAKSVDGVRSVVDEIIVNASDAGQGDQASP